MVFNFLILACTAFGATDFVYNQVNKYSKKGEICNLYKKTIDEQSDIFKQHLYFTKKLEDSYLEAAITQAHNIIDLSKYDLSIEDQNHLKNLSINVQKFENLMNDSNKKLSSITETMKEERRIYINNYILDCKGKENSFSDFSDADCADLEKKLNDILQNREYKDELFSNASNSKKW